MRSPALRTVAAVASAAAALASAVRPAIAFSPLSATAPSAASASASAASSRRRSSSAPLGQSSRAAGDALVASPFPESENPPSSSSLLRVPQQDQGPVFSSPPSDEWDGSVSAVVPTAGEFTPFQIAVRSGAALAALAYAFVPEAHASLDSGVTMAYDAMMSWGPARAPLFEAEVASFGFFASIAFFSSLHLALGEERTKASRFDGKMPTKPFEWAEPRNWQLWFNPLGSYLGSIWLYHMFLHEKAPPPEFAPSFGVLCGELAFGIWLYDLLFYPIHYAYHNSNFGQMRRMHGYHHRISSHALNSLETVQHSYIDGFLQVFVNIVVQQISPFGGFGHKHFMTRVLHNLLVTYLLSEAHSGYDLPWMSHRILPEFLGGAPRHERHHHDGRVYYHQYFKYLDDFFGSTDEGVAKRMKKPKEENEQRAKMSKGVEAPAAA